MAVTRSNIRAGQVQRVVVQYIDSYSSYKVVSIDAIKQGSLKVSSEPYQTELLDGVPAQHGVGISGECEFIETQGTPYSDLITYMNNRYVEVILEGVTATDTMIFAAAQVSVGIKKSFSRKEPDSVILKWKGSYPSVRSVFGYNATTNPLGSLRDYSGLTLIAGSSNTDMSTANFDFVKLPTGSTALANDGGPRKIILPTCCRGAVFTSCYFYNVSTVLDVAGRYFNLANFTGATMPLAYDTTAEFKALVAGYAGATWIDGNPVT